MAGCVFARRRIPHWKTRQRREMAHREALGENPRMVPKMTSQLQLVRDRYDQADLCAGRLLEGVSIRTVEARTWVSGRARSGETIRFEPFHGTNELDPQRAGMRRRMRRVSVGAALRAWGARGWHKLKRVRRTYHAGASACAGGTPGKFTEHRAQEGPRQLGLIPGWLRSRRGSPKGLRLSVTMRRGSM